MSDLGVTSEVRRNVAPGSTLSRRTDQAAAQVADTLPVRAVVARHIGRDAVVILVDADADFVDARTLWRQAKFSAQLNVDFPERSEDAVTGAIPKFGAELQFQYRPRIIVTAELRRFAPRFCLLSKPDILGLLKLRMGFRTAFQEAVPFKPNGP
jgi:hypothetical protein